MLQRGYSKQRYDDGEDFINNYQQLNIIAALLEPRKKSTMMDEEEKGILRRKDVLISGLHALTSCFTYRYFWIKTNNKQLNKVTYDSYDTDFTPL